MSLPNASPTILAIESAVQGGSISLLKGDTEIDFRVGDAGISRAEDILAGIEEILKTNNIERSELDLIAVSTGPGSYTGIRIGIATAIGLKNALNINAAGVPVLTAMAVNLAPAGNVVAAVPIGKRDVCWRLPPGDLMTGTDNDFLELTRRDNENVFIVHPALMDRLTNEAAGEDISDRLRESGQNLAYLIGWAATRSGGLNDLKPIFASVHDRPQS